MTGSSRGYASQDDGVQDHELRDMFPHAGTAANHVDNRVSTKCPCSHCPIVITELLYKGHNTASIARLDAPFDDCSESNVRDIGRRIACQYHLDTLVPLFQKAALLIFDPLLLSNNGEGWTDHARGGSDGTQSARISHSERSTSEEPRHDEQRSSRDSARSSSEQDAHATTNTPDEKLTQAEQLAVDNEPRLTFWDQPWPFRTTCYMLFVAAVVQGWNQIATNGANPCWLDPLIDGTPSMPHASCLSEPGVRIKYGVINAALFLFAPIGCWLSDPLNEALLGRRRAIMVSALLIFSSAIASAFMTVWWHLLICRAILGIGMGGKAAVVPVFLAEIAPTHLRGTLIMNWQVFDALGIFLGFTANLIAASAGPQSAWRWQVASSIIPSFALLLGVMFISWDSPRFQMKHEDEFYSRFERKRKVYESRQAVRSARVRVERRQSGHLSDDGHHPEHDSYSLPLLARVWDSVWYSYGPDPTFGYHSQTFDTLVLLRGSPLLAAKELIYAHCQLVVQQLSATQLDDRPSELSKDVDFSLSVRPSWLQRVGDVVWREKYLGREFTAAAVVMISQQFCGINVLIFYSASIFDLTSSGSSYSYAIFRAPIWLSWGIGLANFLFAIPAYWWIESRGRRWLLLTTIPFLSICLAAAAGSFQITDSDTRRALVALFTFLFVIFYSPGLGPVPFTLSAEIFPLEHRMVGMSLAVSINLLLGGVFTLVVSLIIDNESTLLGIFAGTNIIAWVLIFVFVREPEVTPTEARSRSTAVRLEEIYEIYQPSVWDHVHFQWQHKGDALRSVRDFLLWRETPNTRRHFFIDRKIE